MENKKVAILVLAISAAVLIAVGGVYAATGRQAGVMGNSYPGSTYRSGMGPSMMGGWGGHTGGMMGTWSGMDSMHDHMQQYMWHYWNSTSVP